MTLDPRNLTLTNRLMSTTKTALKVQVVSYFRQSTGLSKKNENPASPRGCETHLSK